METLNMTTQAPEYLRYKLTYVSWLPFGVKGVAVSRRRVLVREGDGRTMARTLRHELQHLRQYRRAGFFWPLVWLWHSAGVGFSYRKHPWEVEARRVAWDDDDRKDWL